MTSERVRPRDDIELGSMGAKWRHGWIPLNPQATAIKLKKMKASGRGHIESHGEHSLLVAPTGRSGRFGALVTKSGESHFSEHATHGDALRAGRQHIAATTHRERVIKSMEPYNRPTQVEAARAARGPRLSARPGTYQGQSGHTVSGTDTRGRSVRVFAPGDRAEADKVKANIKAGREPFAHHKSSTESRGVDKVSEAKSTPFDRAMKKLVPSHNDGTGNMSSGIHETAVGRMIVSKSGGKPWNEQSQLNVEHSNGAMLGHITVQPNGKYDVEDYRGKMPKHEVATHTQALAALGAAHTIHMREIEDKKAADAAKREQSNNDWRARMKAEADAKAAAQKEKDRKAGNAEAARVKAHGDRMRDVAKGIKPTVTKNDSPTKVKARDNLESRLTGGAIDLHQADLNIVSEGQAVKFRADGNDVTGHVVHNGHGIIALSDGRHTYSALTTSRKGRSTVSGSIVKHDAKSDKAMIEAERKRNVVDTTIKVPLKPIPRKADYDKAVALIKQRAAEKRAKLAKTG